MIDHSVQVDYFGTEDSYAKNIDEEYYRNKERYQFLKWAQNSFDNFSVVPPGMGICHQINLEYLSKGVIERNGEIFPDSLVCTDSHTPMVNGIGVVAWGVGGIEAEAAILGQPLYRTARSRIHHPPSEPYTHVRLRCRTTIQGRRHPIDRLDRQRIWKRLLP